MKNEFLMKLQSKLETKTFSIAIQFAEAKARLDILNEILA